MTNTSPPFASRLTQAIERKQNPVCVGLDPTPELLPPDVMSEATDATSQLEIICDQMLSFCLDVISTVHELVPAVKPNIAFFERYGTVGTMIYAEICRFAQSLGLIVIGDIKRGDIGSTAAAYAEAHLLPLYGVDTEIDRFSNCDAVTLNPYLGRDSLQPWIDAGQRAAAGLFLLVKTSNPGSSDLQDLLLQDGTTVSDQVAKMTHDLGQSWFDSEAGWSNIGAVVGATHPQALAHYREMLPQTIFLIPGYGAQGGNARDLKVAFDQHGQGAIVNASRSILGAWKKSSNCDWKTAIKDATTKMIDDLNSSINK